MDYSKQNRQVADTFRVLSVDTRVHIVRLLATHGALCVGKLAEELQVSSGAVSQHLRVMRDNGLVKDERRGYYIHYYLAPGLKEELQQHVEDLFAALTNESTAEQCKHKSGPTCHE